MTPDELHEADLPTAPTPDPLPPLRLVAVHAHPDDESSKGAGTVAKYAAHGVRCTLVCCTGGEEGDILNPAMDTEEVRHNIAVVRRKELLDAVKIIGYHRLVWLGYKDSGMPDSEANKSPDCFANAPEDEAVGRLVKVIRKEKPQVVLTYGHDQEFYPHPDHLRVADVSHKAVEAAADSARYLDLGQAWEVQKVYWSMWSTQRMRAVRKVVEELGVEWPWPEERMAFSNDHLLTTHIPLDGYHSVGRRALIAHRTQIDPEAKFWAAMMHEEAFKAYPYEDWQLAGTTAEELTEDDLFAGVRA